MFERYTEEARRVLFFARYEASQLGSISIETEHVLLGLLRERTGLAAYLLTQFDPGDIQQAVEQRVVFKSRLSTSVEIPFGRETKRVLEFSAEEADRLLHRHIGTEHLLLGLLREERCGAAVILNGLGMRLEETRAQVADESKKQAAPRATGDARYKPHGYASVSPYLVAQGAQRVIDFLKQTFDATEARRYDNEDGTIMHAEVKIDDTIVMLGDAGGEWPAIPMWMHVYVPDVDATYRRALAAGGVSVQEPSRREGDPDRRGGVKDPAGNTWWIATQVEEA